MGPIRVREVLNPGDERPLPTDVTLEGLDVSTSGSYDVLNVLVSSNGSLRLVVDEKTRVVPAVEALGVGWPGRGVAPAAERASPDVGSSFV
jgi:hypothetical protein